MTDRTDIIGNTVTGGWSWVTPPDYGLATTAPDKLIQWLTRLATAGLIDSTGYADRIGGQTEQGQNANQFSILREEIKHPEAIDRAAVMAAWTPPEMPQVQPLPELPDSLQIDFAAIKHDADIDLAELQDSFLSQFFPADVSLGNTFDELFNDVLSGQNTVNATASLNALAEQATTLAAQIKTTTGAALVTSLASVNTNLSGNFVIAKTGVNDAMAQATSNVQNIAWVRARDQVAREAARQEAEAISSMASRGFSLPNGVLLNVISKQRQATLNSASDIAGQEAVKIQQYMIEIAREKIVAFLKFMDSQSSAEITAYKTRVEADLKFGEFQLDILKDNAKRAFDHLGLRLDFTKFAAGEAVRYRLGVIQGWNGLISAYCDTRKSAAQYLEAIARAQTAAYGAIIQYYEAALRQADIGLKLEQANKEIEMKYIGEAANFIARSVANHIQAAASTADVAARLFAAPLQGLNSVASVSVAA